VNGESIIACVVLDPGLSAGVDPASLAGYVASRLASYKKPREVRIVAAIPRLASGTALRRVLKEEYLKEAHGRAAIG
jgi:acyl-CoA synthetase (AMP-forming)/AMP-acid ligase II